MAAIRIFKLGSLAVATVLLGVGAWLAQGALKNLALERRQSAQVQQSLANVQQLMPEVARRERLVRSLQELEAQVDRFGFDPAQWGERRLRRAPEPISRADAAQFLAELDRTQGGAVFVAEVFDIATVSEQAGLFQPPEIGDEGLMLSAHGTLYFKTHGAVQTVGQRP